MTDWEKLKVVELKEACKARDISITGLKLKQQYVDKLVEYDSASQDATPAEESVEDRTNGAFEEVEKEVSPAADKDSTTPTGDDAPRDQEPENESTDVTEDIPLAVEADKHLPSDRPAALKVEDSQDSIGEPEDDVPMADTAKEAEEIKKDDVLIREPEQVQVQVPKETLDNKLSNDADRDEDTKMGDVEASKLELKKEPTPTPIVDDAKPESEAHTPMSDDLRKRKRRSATPPPNAEEVRKKAKGENGNVIVTKIAPSPSESGSPGRVGILEVQEIPKETQETASLPMDGSPPPEDKTAGNKAHRSPTPVADDDRSTEPALHAATRSLYMRNFKRPLNVQTLRSYVLTIAQGISSVAPDEDAIKFWYMNNIRSHAFVTFTNISAASRVRSAMHHTRFPDEPQRDPLWIDFVPDDVVESWVEQETGSSRGQRNSAPKFEVVYNDTGEGYEAVFQDMSAGRGIPQRPSISATLTNRSSLSQRQLSYSADPSRAGTAASGVHPDRAALVLQEQQIRRRSSPPGTVPPQNQHSDQGKGFGALDDLFSFTAAKPKLYFKKVKQELIDDRLDMIRDLYPERGVSGDAGMKRYTFEKQDGREDWVDNGPEFGHGKRGQDRLAGIGRRGRGGFRGRGGRGGGDGRFFGGDSYRGGGRR